MPKSIESADYYNFTPDRQERARVYLGDNMTELERETAHSIASAFEDPARPIADTAVLIPVAAHQDKDYIFHTMGEYAKQRNCDPFTVFVYLNSPSRGVDEAEVEASKHEVKKAIAAYPNLDIRTAFQEYPEVTIGRIRRDLWNAVFMLAYHEEKFQGSDDVIGLNHDIDTMAISPHYISRVQQKYAQLYQRARRLGLDQVPEPPIGTRVSHSVLPSHPNVGRVTNWIDNSYFQMPDHGSYEAGMVIPFGHYAQHGGFNPNSGEHETYWLNEGMPTYTLTSAQLRTSPRRYIARLPEHSSTEIWSPGSFGATDQCREVLPPDISLERAEDLIIERLHSDISNFWLGGVNEYIYTVEQFKPYLAMETGEEEECARVLAEKQIAKAERLLSRLVGSDILARILRDSFDIDSHLKEQIKLNEAIASPQN